MDDSIEEAVLQNKFGTLKAFGEFLANGLFDDAGACETDESAGFGDIEIAEHCKTGGDAAGGGIGEDGDIGNFFVIEVGKSGGNFCELHEADGALHHAGATGGGNGDERLTSLHGQFGGASDFLSYHGAHRPADETELHGTADYGTALQLAFGGDDGVVEAEFFAGVFQAGRVGFGVDKFKRVGGGHAGVVLGPMTVEEHFEALARVHFEMKLALGTDEEIFFEVFAEDDGAAGFALDPEAFGANTALFGRGGLFN